MEIPSEPIDLESQNLPLENKEDLFSSAEDQEVQKEFEDKVASVIKRLYFDFPDLTEEEKDELFSQLQGSSEIIKKAFNKNFLQGPILDSLYDLTNMIIYYYDDGSDPDQNKYTKLGLDIIAQLGPDISKAMREGRLDAKGALAFSDLVDHGNQQQREEGVNALFDSLDLLATGLKSDSYELYSIFFEGIFKAGSQQQIEETGRILAIAVEEADLKKLSKLVSTFFNESTYPEKIINMGWASIWKVLEKLNLPIDEFTEAWAISTNEEGLKTMIYQNLDTIIELELEEPGTTKFLYTEFGITDFGRYPVEMLQKQAEEVNDISKPYGVIIYPRNDWTGVFYGDRATFKDFFKSLEGEFGIRVVECESKIDIVRALFKLNKKYNPADGSGHKISLMIIGGHGAEDKIILGGDDDKNYLGIADLMGKGTGKAIKFFEENLTIILASCSTGAEEGIGQELSQKLGVKVIAPRVSSRFKAIYANKNKEQNKFEFDAEFREEGHKNTFVQGIVSKRDETVVKD